MLQPLTPAEEKAVSGGSGVEEIAQELVDDVNRVLTDFRTAVSMVVSDVLNFFSTQHPPETTTPEATQPLTTQR